jgi:hypothetical protein
MVLNRRVRRELLVADEPRGGRGAHLAAIYRKLPASRRRDAVLRARELELI